MTIPLAAWKYLQKADELKARSKRQWKAMTAGGGSQSVTKQPQQRTESLGEFSLPAAIRLSDSPCHRSLQSLLKSAMSSSHRQNALQPPSASEMRLRQYNTLARLYRYRRMPAQRIANATFANMSAIGDTKTLSAARQGTAQGESCKVRCSVCASFRDLRDR